ncbi:MAG: ferrous iron transport protein A [Clostridia bacterium]|nr:ferrous iron transport protein A [Clostridia bacterium]
MRRLSELAVDESGVISYIDTKNRLRRRLYDLGLVPGTKVFCVAKSPLGDPKAFLVRGAVISLRCEDSEDIILE